MNNLGITIFSVCCIGIAIGSIPRLAPDRTGGAATADNRYPLFARSDAGDEGFAELYEEMRVNLTERHTIAVDARLDDCEGVLPQAIEAAGAAERTLEEAAWLPFVLFARGRSAGKAVGTSASPNDVCDRF
jgi:hypothetical protein